MTEARRHTKVSHRLHTQFRGWKSFHSGSKLFRMMETNSDFRSNPLLSPCVYVWGGAESHKLKVRKLLLVWCVCVSGHYKTSPEVRQSLERGSPAL